MKNERTSEHRNTELSEFLRRKRERILPGDVGLPHSGRRRTPGLRREEVAALAGVGLTWYTWLEQGRNISVSAMFLDNLSSVLKLDAAERRYLFLLTHQRPPIEPGKTWCIVPSIIHCLMKDLKLRPAYVINLRWDVLAWNEAADRIFNFSRYEPSCRNLLWLVFAEQAFRTLFNPWPDQAHKLLSHFRRDFVRATQEPDINSLIKELQKIDPDFRCWWQEQDIHGPCYDRRQFNIPNVGCVSFEHTLLTIDEDRHLRLAYYSAIQNEPDSQKFEEWLSK